MKKKILTTLSVVLILGLAALGILAYLMDEDSDVNVMTLGNVQIEQIEQERADDGTLQDFTGNNGEPGKPLFPAVYPGNSTSESIPWDVAANWAVAEDEAWKTVVENDNVVDKFVTVKNTGESAAYVRTIIAYEGDAINGTDIHIVHNAITSSNTNVSGEFAATEYIEDVDIDGVRYDVIVYTYKDALAKNETTIPSLKQVYMDHTCTNDDVAKYGDTYDILVLSQAVQAEGFADAEAALKAGFGEANAANIQEWFGGMEVPAAVDTADELAAALKAGKSAYLTEDVTVTSTMDVAAGKDVKLNLNGNDLSYAVSNSGASAIINNKGSLEIEGKGTISFTAENPDMQAIPSYATNTITNTGRLVIGEGVTVTNGSDGGASYAVDNHGEFVLNGGTLIGDRCALRVAKYNQDNVKFVMNSGVIKAKTPAWIQLPGSDSNVAPKINVTINGGTFESTKATSADNNVLYTYSYGNSHANTSITINGGEFLGGTVSIGSGYKGDVPTLKINGGTFEYDVLQWLENDGSNVLYEVNK